MQPLPIVDELRQGEAVAQGLCLCDRGGGLLRRGRVVALRDPSHDDAGRVARSRQRDRIRAAQRDAAPAPLDGVLGQVRLGACRHDADCQPALLAVEHHAVALARWTC